MLSHLLENVAAASVPAWVNYEAQNLGLSSLQAVECCLTTENTKLKQQREGNR